MPVISHCARSPWFAKTCNDASLYGEYAGRLVLLSLGGDPVDEYWTLRRAAGLFDVPERPLEIRGPGAAALLDHALTRPVERLPVGRGSYGLLCHQGGGLVCDGIVFRLGAQRFWYVHADNDVRLWLLALARDFDVEVEDPHSWVLQVQGPTALDVLARACDGDVPAGLRYFGCFECTMGGQPVLVSRTGWTGELGFEVYNLAADVDGPALWDHLLAAGADHGLRPCAQRAMNIRRIEAGILNYPTDIDMSTTPWDAGLGAFVDLQGRDFVGRDALLAAPREPRFAGFRCAGSAPIAFNAEIRAGEETLGRVTAYEVSPYLACGVGFLRFEHAGSRLADGLVALDRDGNAHTIEVLDPPFYDRAGNLPRGKPLEQGDAG